jgi:hypothetical protein
MCMWLLDPTEYAIDAFDVYYLCMKRNYYNI